MRRNSCRSCRPGADGGRERSGSAGPHPEGSDRPRRRCAARHHACNDQLHLSCVRPRSHCQDLRYTQRIRPATSRSRSAMRLGPNALPQTHCVLSQNSTMVPFSQITSLTPAVAPIVVNHQGQFPSVTFDFNLGQARRSAPRFQRPKGDGRHMPRSIAASFRQCPRRPELAQHYAPSDPRGVVRCLYHSWHAL